MNEGYQGGCQGSHMDLDLPETEWICDLDFLATRTGFAGDADWICCRQKLDFGPENEWISFASSHKQK